LSSAKDEEASLLVTQKEINKLEKGYGDAKVKKEHGISIIDLLADDSDDGWCSLRDGDNGLKKKSKVAKKESSTLKKKGKWKKKGNKKKIRDNTSGSDSSSSNSATSDDDSGGDMRKKGEVRSKISKLRKVALSRHNN
jgi:hypothetical protein